MSAFWFMGSPDFVPDPLSPTYDPQANEYAILPMPGTQASPLVQTLAYPRIFTPLEIATIFYKARKYRCQINSVVTVGSDTYTSATDVLLVNVDGMTDELEIVSTVRGTVRPTSFEVGATGTVTVSSGGAVSVPVSGDLQFFNTNNPDSYYYDPATELYLPRVAMDLFPAYNSGGVFRVTNTDISGNPSYNGPGEPFTIAGTCDFFGEDITVWLAVGGDSLVSFSMSISEAAGVSDAYWGWNGTWDTTTGDELLDHLRHTAP